MVQILLMLKVLFTQNSEAEYLFCNDSPGSEPSLFSSNNLFRFQPVRIDFQHMTLLGYMMRLIILLFCQSYSFLGSDNQRLSPWGRRCSCSQDLITDLC